MGLDFFSEFCLQHSLVTLPPLSSSHNVSECWKMACLHPSCIRKFQIFTYIHCWDMSRTDLILVTLTPFFVIIQGLRMLINGFSARYVLAVGMAGFLLHLHILLEHGQEVIRCV